MDHNTDDMGPVRDDPLTEATRLLKEQVDRAAKTYDLAQRRAKDAVEAAEKADVVRRRILAAYDALTGANENRAMPARDWQER